MAKWVRAVHASVAREYPSVFLDVAVTPEVLTLNTSYYVLLDFVSGEFSRLQSVELRVEAPTLETAGLELLPVKPTISWAWCAMLWLGGTSALLVLVHRYPTGYRERGRYLTSAITKAAPDVTRRLRAIANEDQWAMRVLEGKNALQQARIRTVTTIPYAASLSGSISLLTATELWPVASHELFPAANPYLAAAHGLFVVCSAAWGLDVLLVRSRFRKAIGDSTSNTSAEAFLGKAFPELRGRLRSLLARRVATRLLPVLGKTDQATGSKDLVRLLVQLRREEAAESQQLFLAQTLPENDLPPLEVVLFPLDFELISEPIQHVALPPLGSTQYVDFLLRLPAAPGRARLRFGIFLRDRLIQSVLIETDVTSGRVAAAIDERIEFTETKDFHGVEAMSGRLLSIAVNEHKGHHTITFKKGGTTHTFSPSEAVVSQSCQKARQVLLEATCDEDRNHRFDTRPTDPKLSPAFHEYMAQLAEVGHRLHHELFLGSQISYEDVAACAASEDGIIRIVRLVANHSFPWQLVYDFLLPDPDEAGADTRVCPGEREGKPCGHTRAHRVYCARGFWGIRHQIEQILDNIRADAAAPVIPASVGVVVGQFDECAAFEKTLLSNLEKHMPQNQAAPVQFEDDLLTALARSDERPGALIVLGHLSKGRRGHRIALRAPGAPLSVEGIVNHAMETPPWSAPHAMVFLMACEGLQLDVDTLHSFALATYKLGASAVVGPESPIFTALGERFATDVVGAIFGDPGLSLGAAITRFRRQLAAEGNPLGLAFTFLGAADLKPSRRS